MTRKKRSQPLLSLILTFPLLSFVSGCATKSSGKEKSLQSNGSVPTVALGASFSRLKTTEDGKIVPLQEVASRLRSYTDISFDVLDGSSTRTLEDSLTAAATRGRNIVLYMQYPVTGESPFLNASLHVVADGELIGEEGVLRETVASTTYPLAKWLRDLLPVIQKVPEFDPLSYAERLERRDKCRELAGFVSDYPSKKYRLTESLHQVLARCKARLVEDMEIPTAYLLNFSMRDVPAKIQEEVMSTTNEMNLRRHVFGMTRYLTELIVQCRDGCKAASIEFLMPFDDDRYCFNMRGAGDHLMPFRELASKFLVLRDVLMEMAGTKNRKNFDVAIRIKSSSPSKMTMDVTGSVENTKVEPNAEMDRYLKLIAKCEINRGP